MKTRTLEVMGLADGLAAFRQAWSSGKAEENARIAFATPELLWKVLTAKQWGNLRVMTGQGPLALPEVAQRLEREVKAIHADVHALINAGLLQRTTGDGSSSLMSPFMSISC